MHAGAGGQLDDVSVRVAEIDRPDKAMIDRAAHLFSFRLRFSQHRIEDVVVDGERDVQVERILPLEIRTACRGPQKTPGTTRPPSAKTCATPAPPPPQTPYPT